MRCVEVSPAAGTAGWWEVGPVEQRLGIRDAPAPPFTEVPMEMSVSDSPYPAEAELESAEDHRRFDRGDAERYSGSFATRKALHDWFEKNEMLATRAAAAGG
jgi:hypothetical protein